MNFHDISTLPLLFPRHFHDVRIRRRVCGPRAPARRFSTAFPRSPSKIHDKSTSRPSTAHFHAISTPSRISMAHFHGVSPIDAVADSAVRRRPLSPYCRAWLGRPLTQTGRGSQIKESAADNHKRRWTTKTTMVEGEVSIRCISLAFRGRCCLALPDE